MTPTPDSRPPRVLVCTGRNCDSDGCGSRIYAALEAVLNEADPLAPPFLLRTVNCLDMCEQGPNMVIYPGNRRHSHLDPDRALDIVRQVVGESEGAS